MTNGAAVARYRELLHGEGEATQPGQNGDRGRKGMTKEHVQKVIAKGGKLSRFEMLRCRVRYFTDGVAFGTKDFVNAVFVSDRGSIRSKTQDRRPPSKSNRSRRIAHAPGIAGKCYHLSRRTSFQLLRAEYGARGNRVFMR